MAKKEISFEDALKRLEETVETLEEGELPLKESLAKFEEGMKLRQLCNHELEMAEQRIEKLVEKEGKIITEPFDEIE